MRCGGLITVVRGLLPISPDRLAIANWQGAGMQSKGGPSGAGIPNRTTVSSTLSPLGGTNVTISVASPAVVTMSSGTAPAADTPIFLDTTIFLPPPLLQKTIYYVKSPSGGTFQVAATSGGASINTTGAGSGTHSFLIDDVAQIQAANNSCPAGQVVLLNGGTFITGSNPIIVNSGITLRGSGAGVTTLYKPNGGQGESSFTGTIAGTVLTISALAPGNAIYVGQTIVAIAGVTTIASFGTGTGGTGTYNLAVAPGDVGSPTIMQTGGNQGPMVNAILIVGPGQFGFNFGTSPDNSSASTTLTADGLKGSSSITVANASIFTGGVGQIVLLDELSGARWMPDNIPTNGAAGYQIWASYDYDVVYQKHWPAIQFVDDFAAANLTASISGTTLNVTVGASDISLGPPAMVLSGAGIPTPGLGNDVTIVSGGGSTWTISQNLGTIGSEAMLAATYPYQSQTFGDAFSRLDRVKCEIKEISSIVGNIISFTSPLMRTYKVGRTAQLSFLCDTGSNAYKAHLQGAGIESLSLQGGDDGNLHFVWCAYCWAKNIESLQWNGQGVNFIGSFRVEMRHSYCHDPCGPRPTGGAYAICEDAGSSEILTEDCISVRTNKVMVARASGAGSVFGYNYTDMGMIDFQQTWIEKGLNGSHLAGPHHTLFEGNYGVNLDSDITHGNSTFHTFFRNWARGIRGVFVNPFNNATIDDTGGGAGPMRTVGMDAYTYNMTVIGNVLGASGQMSGWINETVTLAQPGVFFMGNEADYLGSTQIDPYVKSTMIRDGNWNWLNSAQEWYTTPAKYAIPNSLYLPYKLAFFGSNTWPWVDPSTGTTYTLPAKARFDAGHPNV